MGKELVVWPGLSTRPSKTAQKTVGYTMFSWQAVHLQRIWSKLIQMTNFIWEKPVLPHNMSTEYERHTALAVTICLLPVISTVLGLTPDLNRFSTTIQSPSSHLSSMLTIIKFLPGQPLKEEPGLSTSPTCSHCSSILWLEPADTTQIKKTIAFIVQRN